MNRWTVLFAAMLITALLAISCSGGGGNPAAPTTTDLGTPGSLNNAGQVQTHLWGYYDVHIDIVNQTAEVVVNRSMMFAANVVDFLNNDPAGVGISNLTTDMQATYVDCMLDISLAHPLTITEYNGYDVRGIFCGDGSGTMTYNGDLDYQIDGDQIMMNADGYTRWFNATEFSTSGVLGYTPGAIASPGYNPGATLMPYKYFADGLNANDGLWGFLTTTVDEGVFSANQTNTRHYEIRFPLGAPGVTFGYAVVANWEGEDPSFHPANAPEALAVSVNVDPELWWESAPSAYGGDLVMDIDVFDWEANVNSVGLMEDYTIYIESDDLSVNYMADTFDMTAIGGTGFVSTYHLDIPATPSFNVSTGLAEYWVIVAEADEDYTNTFGVTNGANTDKLAAFFRFDDLYIHYMSYNFTPVISSGVDGNASPMLSTPETYTVTAYDNDPLDTLTYSWDVTDVAVATEVITDDPGDGLGGLLIDFTTIPGAVTGMVYDIDCEVTDTKDIAVATTLTVTVVNSPPVITSGVTGNASPHSTETYTVVATDADGDPLTWSWNVPPLIAGSAGNGDGTIAINWAALGASLGTPYNIDCTVTDSIAAPVAAATLIATCVNQSPVINTGVDGPASGYTFQTANYSVGATDGDGDTLGYTWTVFDLFAGSAVTVGITYHGNNIDVDYSVIGATIGDIFLIDCNVNDDWAIVAAAQALTSIVPFVPYNETFTSNIGNWYVTQYRYQGSCSNPADPAWTTNAPFGPSGSGNLRYPPSGTNSGPQGGWVTTCISPPFMVPPGYTAAYMRIYFTARVYSWYGNYYNMCNWKIAVSSTPGLAPFYSNGNESGVTVLIPTGIYGSTVGGYNGGTSHTGVWNAQPTWYDTVAGGCWPASLTQFVDLPIPVSMHNSTVKICFQMQPDWCNDALTHGFAIDDVSLNLVP